jgi:four helix bundle protein
MMKRERNILLEKSEAFAGRIVKMYQYLTSQKNEFIISKQILRSGTSIGANLTESKNAQSTSDYINKQNIALKEADETAYWLKNLIMEVISMIKNTSRYPMIVTSLSKCLSLPSKHLKVSMASNHIYHFSSLISHL